MEPKLVMWNTPELIFSTHISIQKCLMWRLILQSEIQHENSKQNHLPIECASSVQFSHSVMSDSLQPHGLQHSRPPCPSPTPGIYSNSYPLSWQCHPTIASSVIPLSSCLQSILASGLFKWVSSSHQVAKVLEFQLQHQSFQWLFRTDIL